MNDVKQFLQNFLTRIPWEYQEEFSRQIARENLLKLFYGAILVILIELVMLPVFSDSKPQVTYLVIGFIIVNVFYLILYKIVHMHRLENQYLLLSIQFSYLLAVLAFGCTYSVFQQDALASINLYILVVFSIAAFVYIPPLSSFVLYFSVYIAFVFILPYYQTDPYAVKVLRFNGMAMNVMAWALSRMVFSLKVNVLIHLKEIQQKKDVLKELVVRDSMTGLYNHKNIFFRLAEEIERAKRIRYPLSLIMLDIDHFKEINDQFGHPVGDTVILKMAQILTETCRTTDLIGRYGGDEFIIILPDTSGRDAVGLAERIHLQVKACAWGFNRQITISGGICRSYYESAEELIKCVDAKLYQAKSCGRDRFEVEMDR